MKKKLIGLTILAAMVVFACAGCVGVHADGPDSAIPAANGGVSSAIPSAPDASPTNPSSTEEPGGGVEKMDVTITIDGEDYAFPMSYEEFEARGWTLSYGSELWEDGLNPGYHRGSLFFSKGDIKALEVIFYNPTDSFQGFADCEVAGIRVDYDQRIYGEDAEQVMNIPAGSIQINGQGIGEAGRGDIVAALGKDWNLERSPDASPDDFDGFLYWLNGSGANDDSMTLSFDETGVLTEMTFLKTE